MSRILEQQYEIVPIDNIRPHPMNARRGNTAGICESIATNGFFGAVYVQRSSGLILAGKHRWDSAKREGLGEIPVLWLEVNDSAAKKILTADNRLSDQAQYDQHALAELLTEISAESGLAGSGFDQAGLDAIISSLGNEAISLAESQTAADESGANNSDAPGAPAERPLLESLIARPTFNKKRTLRFLSLRKWNSDGKKAAIDAFKLAKQVRDTSIVEAAAGELVTALREFGGNWREWVVTAPPAGASAASGWHMATEITRAAALRIGAEFVPIFAERPRSGGSHPRTFDNRGDVVLLAPVDGLNILIIDDIASTGTTLEECKNELLKAGAETVIAISWVYEEAEERPEAA